MITEQTASVALNPCPFCAGRGELVVLEHESIPELEPIYFIICHDCDARGSHCDNPFDAEKWWNGEKLAIAIAEREQDAAYDEGVVMRPGEAKEMFVEG